MPSSRQVYSPLTALRTEFNHAMRQLSSEQRRDASIRHVLQVYRAIVSGNFLRLFQLWEQAPKMGPYILDGLVERERVKALLVLAKA